MVVAAGLSTPIRNYGDVFFSAGQAASGSGDQQQATSSSKSTLTTAPRRSIHSQTFIATHMPSPTIIRVHIFRLPGSFGAGAIKLVAGAVLTREIVGAAEQRSPD
jgi:hypothetical protein